MVFSDPTTSQGIVEETHFFANSTPTTYSINQITRNVNRALDRVAYLIQGADQLWQFDDQNYSDLPIATTDLVADQTDYSIDQTFLKILKVEVADANGKFYSIEPINVDDPNFRNVSENTTSGYPIRYDKNANSVLLYPAPNYSTTAGIKIYYQRNMQYFETTDTVKEPGFNPQFHRILPLYAALDLCLSKDLPQTKNLEFKIEVLEKDLLDFYSNRGKDEPPIVRSIIISSR